MKRAEAVEIATGVAWNYLGHWYTWGGDDPAGFDCSGLVIEVLKSVGLLPRGGDWTAHSLWQIFRPERVDQPSEGCLVFYRNADRSRVVHVEYCLNGGVSIGASGGGSTTRTIDDAIRQNAFIKIRPVRAGASFANPFLRTGE